MINGEFLQEMQVGVRVRALTTVYDSPGAPDPGPIHAIADDLGTVVYAQAGCFPTVKFDRTGGSTCVNEFEVEIVLLQQEGP